MIMKTRAGLPDGREEDQTARKENKTNAMRELEREKIPYVCHTYECDEFTDGVQVADLLHLSHELVYKTLVCEGNDRNYYVFVLPVEEELDLKKCAKSMIHVKDINKVTGYVRGGCTAIGMKKRYVTRIDDSARKLPRMIVSGGRLGTQMELKPEDLCQAAGAEFASLT